MNTSLTDAIKEAFTLVPSTQVIFHTLEIRQEGVQAPIYIVQAQRGLVAKTEDGHWKHFEPVGFQFTLPPSTEEGFQSLNVSIDNVGRRVTDFVVAAQLTPTPIQMIYRPYLSTDLTRSQMVPPLVLYLKDVQITTMQVTGRATFMDIVNKKFPSILYNRAAFPTL